MLLSLYTWNMQSSVRSPSAVVDHKRRKNGAGRCIGSILFIRITYLVAAEEGGEKDKVKVLFRRGPGLLVAGSSGRGGGEESGEGGYWHSGGLLRQPFLPFQPQRWQRRKRIRWILQH